MWLQALVEFSHHSGLIQKAKFVPIAKKREDARQQWQYTTNADQVNDELLMRMPKWARDNMNANEDARQKARALRKNVLDGGDENYEDGGD